MASPPLPKKKASRSAFIWLTILFLIAAGATWIGFRIYKVDQIGDQIEDLGGGVDATYFDGIGSERVMFMIYVPGYDRREFSADELEQVRSIVADLDYFIYLRYVSVDYTNIPPDILIDIVQTLDIKVLSASYSELNDDVLDAIPDSSPLEVIYSEGTSVTDAGIKRLTDRKQIVVHR